MKDYVPMRSKKRVRLNPLTLILFNAFLPVLNTFFPSTKGLTFTMLFVMTVLLVFGPFKTFLKASVYLTVFFSLYYLSDYYIHSDILVSFFRMSVLFLPMFILAFLLISGYHSSEILSALERLWLPKIFVISLTVTLRYIPTFRKEFKIIREAMEIRGVKFSFLKPLRTFEYLIVPQLFRCMHLSGELTAAALTKGIKSPKKRSSFFVTGLSLWDYGTMAVFVSGFGLIIGKII